MSIFYNEWQLRFKFKGCAEFNTSYLKGHLGLGWYLQLIPIWD